MQVAAESDTSPMLEASPSSVSEIQVSFTFFGVSQSCTIGVPGSADMNQDGIIDEEEYGDWTRAQLDDHKTQISAAGPCLIRTLQVLRIVVFMVLLLATNCTVGALVLWPYAVWNPFYHYGLTTNYGFKKAVDLELRYDSRSVLCGADGDGGETDSEQAAGNLRVRMLGGSAGKGWGSVLADTKYDLLSFQLRT